MLFDSRLFQKRYLRILALKAWRSRLLILPVLIVLFFYGFVSTEKSVNRKWWNHLLCVDSHTALVAPPADGFIIQPNVEPNQWSLYYSASPSESDRRIFFHETSGRTRLSLQQCCAVESAAHHNPDRPVRLFLRPPTSCSTRSTRTPSVSNQPCLNVLSSYPNVAVVVLNEDYYFAGTPLEKWYTEGVWRQSRFKMAHLADYIRMLTLSKGGGLYMDMDVITLKPFNDSKLNNFLVYGNDAMEELSNTVLHLQRRHWLTDEIIQVIAKEYDPEAYAFHGPDAISEVMHRECGLLARHPESNECGDSVRVLPDDTFYPIPSIISQIFFMDNGNQTDAQLGLMKKSFGVHLWNSVTIQHKRPLDVGSNQLAAILARRHCPTTVAKANTFNAD